MIQVRERIVLAGSCCASIVVAILIALVMVGSAQAGSFTLLSCEGTTASAGWSAFSTNAPAGTIGDPACNAAWPQVKGELLGAFPPAMDAGLPNGTPPPARAGLLFSVPGESIVGGEVWVNAQTYYGSPNYSGIRETELALGAPESVFWKQEREGQRVKIPGSGTELIASAVCEGKPCEAENIYVMGAHLELSPTTPPAVSAIGGSLSAGGSLHGTQAVSFTASDRGPGVYQVTAAIDGKVIYQGTPNPNGGVCAPIGSYSGTPEFLTPTPCPASVPISLPVQTGSLPDGIHALTVTATDAAGNISKASEILFRSENLIIAAGAGRVPRNLGPGPAPNYLLHLDPASTTLSHGIHRPYNASGLTVTGTLTTPLGVPAPGVAVHLLASTNSDPSQVLATATTDALGHWTLSAPKGPTRTLRIAYGQVAASSTQSAEATRETVSPSVSLRVINRRGGRLTFTGRLAITPLGRPRPLVVIEASSDARRWQTLGKEVRVNSYGIYHLSYSSSASVGGHFAFRAMTPATSEWQEGLTVPQWLAVR